LSNPALLPNTNTFPPHVPYPDLGIPPNALTKQ
jgi:hypothetical protein